MIVILSEHDQLLGSVEMDAKAIYRLHPERNELEVLKAPFIGPLVVSVDSMHQRIFDTLLVGRLTIGDFHCGHSAG
jgi:hypothetical protein